jgi:hypothetical protein
VFYDGFKTMYIRADKKLNEMFVSAPFSVFSIISHHHHDPRSLYLHFITLCEYRNIEFGREMARACRKLLPQLTADWETFFSLHAGLTKYSLHALMNDMAYEMPGSELDFLAELIKDSGINAPDEAFDNAGAMDDSIDLDAPQLMDVDRANGNMQQLETINLADLDDLDEDGGRRRNKKRKDLTEKSRPSHVPDTVMEVPPHPEEVSVGDAVYGQLFEGLKPTTIRSSRISRDLPFWETFGLTAVIWIYRSQGHYQHEGIHAQYSHPQLQRKSSCFSREAGQVHEPSRTSIPR